MIRVVVRISKSSKLNTNETYDICFSDFLHFATNNRQFDTRLMCEMGAKWTQCRHCRFRHSVLRLNGFARTWCNSHEKADFEISSFLFSNSENCMVFIFHQISLAQVISFSLNSASNSENSGTQSPEIHHRTDKTGKAGSGSGYADSLLNSTELSRLELTDPDYDFYKKLINLTSNQNLVWHFKHGFDQADPIILYCFDDRPDNPAQLTRFLECEKEFQSFDSLNNQYIKSLIHKLLQLDSVTIKAPLSNIKTKMLTHTIIQF